MLENEYTLVLELETQRIQYYPACIDMDQKAFCTLLHEQEIIVW